MLHLLKNNVCRSDNESDDALIGGLLETKEDGAILPPTLSCAFQRVSFFIQIKYSIFQNGLGASKVEWNA